MNLIAVWGSSGAGKTAVSLALAAALVREKRDVLVIGADSRAPALPVYLPKRTDLTMNHSLGGLLEQTEVSEGALKDRVHRHPGSDRLYFMGLISGELAGISYKPPQRPALASLLRRLEQSPFDTVLIDCDASPVYDGLTLLALEQARTVPRVMTPDVKGYEFQKAQLTWLGRSDAFRVERHVKIANPVYPHTPLKEASALFGGFDYTLPYARQVSERLTAGELLCAFHDPEGIAFEAQLQRLMKEVNLQND